MTSSALLNAHHPVTPSPHPPLLQQPSVCFLSLRASYGLSPSLISSYFIFPSLPLDSLFCFLNSTYEWNHMRNSSFIHIIVDNKISSFSMAEWYSIALYKFHCTCVYIHISHLLYPFVIRQWTCGLLLYLDYNNDAINIRVHLSFWISAFIFFA